ncbi:MAG: AAA family ATPase [Arcobacteraceae bacterium]|nr:AAA family ATPase [Arcobacteraceae bacterium]
MSWMIKSDKLDVEQKHFIFEEVTTGKNIWIKGFAGSGKSVLLVHAIIEKLKEDPNVSVCIVVFTHSLIEMFQLGMNELGIDGNIELMTYFKFNKGNEKYDYIFCDEVQDLPASILKNMKERSKQLILAGDSHQSIYDENPDTGESTVTPSKIGNITGSTEYELSTIYRLTKSIVNVVSLLLPKMNIFDAKTDRTKQDITVKLCSGRNCEMEVEYIIKEAEELTSIDESVVIILPKHDDIITFINIILDIKKIEQWDVIRDNYNNYKYDVLNKYLKENDMNIEYVGNRHGDLSKSLELKKIIFMTYHSSKGLDFDNVFLPFMSNLSNIRNETLFMVGMTRSKKNLYLTYSETMHKYVKQIDKECTKIDIDSILNKNDTSLDIDF